MLPLSDIHFLQIFTLTPSPYWDFCLKVTSSKRPFLVTPPETAFLSLPNPLSCFILLLGSRTSCHYIMHPPVTHLTYIFPKQECQFHKRMSSVLFSSVSLAHSRYPTNICYINKLIQFKIYSLILKTFPYISLRPPFLSLEAVIAARILRLLYHKNKKMVDLPHFELQNPYKLVKALRLLSVFH